MNCIAEIDSDGEDVENSEDKRVMTSLDYKPDGYDGFPSSSSFVSSDGISNGPVSQPVAPLEKLYNMQHTYFSFAWSIDYRNPIDRVETQPLFAPCCHSFSVSIPLSRISFFSPIELYYSFSSFCHLTHFLPSSLLHQSIRFPPLISLFFLVSIGLFIVFTSIVRSLDNFRAVR